MSGMALALPNLRRTRNRIGGTTHLRRDVPAGHHIAGRARRQACRASGFVYSTVAGRKKHQLELIDPLCVRWPRNASVTPRCGARPQVRWSMSSLAAEEAEQPEFSLPV